MKKSATITGLVLAGMLSLSLAAQEPKRGKGTDDDKRSRQRDAVRQDSQSAQQSPNQPAAQPGADRPQRIPQSQFVPARPMDRPPDDRMRGRRGGDPNQLHPHGPRPGDWLRQFKDVPEDQQERALTNDPAFQRLPSDRQQQLRQRLQRFNNLSPDQKERLLDRMEKFEALPPEQRQRLQGIQERMRQLPDDRQQRLRRAFHQLKGMSAEQRQEYFGSNRFQERFTQEEREILKGLTEIEDSPELAEPQDPRAQD